MSLTPNVPWLWKTGRYEEATAYILFTFFCIDKKNSIQELLRGYCILCVLMAYYGKIQISEF